MRALIDALLSFIGASSLTDVEFAGLGLSIFAYNTESYDAILAVLVSREAVSSETDRLKYYYLARGVEVVEPVTGKSNILIGASL